MANVSRSTLNNLINRLLEDGASVSFEGAVRLLEEVHADAQPIGYEGPPRQEAVRFRQNTSLGFSTSDLQAAQRVADDGSGFRGFELVTNFLGLAGIDSPLPASYLEDLQHAEVDEEGDILLGLLNIFHHRMVSYLFRTLTKYQHAHAYRADGSDALSQRLGALAGGSTSGFVDNGLRLQFLPTFLRQARSEAAIETVLDHWFADVDLKVESCVPQWVRIPADQRVQLGQLNHQLGVDAVLGEFVRDASTMFAIEIGPLTREQFTDFLPNGAAAHELRMLLRQIDLDGLSVQVKLILDDDVEPVRLSTKTEEQSTLGWSTWLAGEVARPTTMTYTWEVI